jgi:hypothetical protein
MLGRTDDVGEEDRCDHAAGFQGASDDAVRSVICRTQVSRGSAAQSGDRSA